MPILQIVIHTIFAFFASSSSLEKNTLDAYRLIFNVF